MGISSRLVLFIKRVFKNSHATHELRIGLPHDNIVTFSKSHIRLTLATLRWPTFSMASHKEGEKFMLLVLLFARSGERVVERSNDRVSQHACLVCDLYVADLPTADLYDGVPK
jgi:hypothetical protein